jgi:hypothetical protein
MAYQAIICGARGLTFFGGHATQITRPRDAKAGWNWTFWIEVLHPLLTELTSTAVHPALTAPNATATLTADANDIELVSRDHGRFLYVIAVRRGNTTSKVSFTGLPHQHNGAPLTSGQVLFEYSQDPLPPPILTNNQQFRTIPVTNNTYADWFGPHDTHLYRFQL